MGASMWDEYFTDSVSVLPYLGQNGLSEPVYGTEYKISARVEFKFKAVVDNMGNDVISEGFVLSSNNFAPRSKVIIDGNEYEIIINEPTKVLFGDIDHYEGWFK